MKSFEIGYMRQEWAERIKLVLEGQTYMNFHVSLGIDPGGTMVTLSTDYEADDAEILTMALHIMAGRA